MLPCPLCNAMSSLYFHSKDYNRRISNETFTHYHCPSCGLIFIAPIPQNLGNYYPTNYYSNPPSQDQLTVGAVHERYKIDIIQKFVTGGRLLEIGPAYGNFSWLAKQSGFEVETIEMDAKCCQFLSKVIGVRTINNSDICAALKGLIPYNVIALWHVIEHLPDPWRTLEAINEKLLPGGILVIATPNPDAFQFHFLGKYWPHVDAPRHLMLIPAPLIIKKMESLGFKTAFFTTTDKGSLGWNRFGWEHFFSNLCSLKLINITLKLIGRVVSVLTSPIEDIEGKGSAYTLIFVKERHQ